MIEGMRPETGASERRRRSKARSGARSKAQDAIWTRVVIDPVADRVVPRLARIGWVTPNRVTAVAGLLAVAACWAFLSGHLVLAGVLFQLRFFVDCLDGKLARLQGTSSRWGASWDLIVDVVGITCAYAAAGHHVVATGASGPLLLAGLLVGNGLYVWTLAHRKSLPGGGQHDWVADAERYEAARRLQQAGDDPADGQAEEASAPPTGVGTGGLSLWQRYVAFMARRGMVPTPYAVEVEAFALTLVPLAAGLTGEPALLAAGLWCATAFYVVATLLNVYRIQRLATAWDRAPVSQEDA